MTTIPRSEARHRLAHEWSLGVVLLSRSATICLLALILLEASCAVIPPMPEPPADHPASAEAELPNEPHRDYLLDTGAEATPSHPQNLPVASKPDMSSGHQMTLPMGEKTEGK